jgi:hypothetical protein
MIITRFSVPTNSAVAKPIENWNNDSRSSLESGKSGEAASANGIQRASMDAVNFRTMVCSVLMTDAFRLALMASL